MHDEPGDWMENTTRSAGADQPQVAGPAAVAGAMRLLDRHVRAIVKLAIAQHGIRDGDLAQGVAQRHDRIARVLHEISLEHGTDAMNTAAEYAAAALDAGSIYQGEELEDFLRSVAAAVRTTTRELSKSTPFGS